MHTAEHTTEEVGIGSEPGFDLDAAKTAEKNERLGHRDDRAAGEDDEAYLLWQQAEQERKQKKKSGSKNPKKPKSQVEIKPVPQESAEDAARLEKLAFLKSLQGKGLIAVNEINALESGSTAQVDSAYTFYKDMTDGKLLSGGGLVRASEARQENSPTPATEQAEAKTADQETALATIPVKDEKPSHYELAKTLSKEEKIAFLRAQGRLSAEQINGYESEDEADLDVAYGFYRNLDDMVKSQETEPVESRSLDANKPRVVPLGPKELKPVMKTINERPLSEDEKTMQWEPVVSYVDNLERQYGFNITLGSGLTVDESMDAYARLEAQLAALPRESYQKRYFKPVHGPSRVRSDQTIEFNIDSSDEDLHRLFTETLNVSSQELAVKKEADEKSELIEGEPVGIEPTKEATTDVIDADFTVDGKEDEENVPLYQGEIVEEDEDPKIKKNPKTKVLTPELVIEDEAPGAGQPKEKNEANEDENNKEEKGRIVEFRPTQMPVGTAVNVETLGHTYKIEMRKDGLYISGDPEICPNPSKVVISGSDLPNDMFAKRQIITKYPFVYGTETSRGPVTTEAVSSIELSPERAGETVEENKAEPEKEKGEPKQLAAAGPETPTVQPERFTEQELKDRLEKAREKYVEAKKVLSEHQQLLSIRKLLSGQSKETVAAAFEQAQVEYNQCRAEYVGANTEKYLQEKIDLNRAHLEEYGKLDKNLVNQTQRLWNWMGELNLNNLRSKESRDKQGDLKKSIERAFSVRNVGRAAVMTLLLTTGAYWSAIGARAATGFLSTRGLSEDVRQARVAKAIPLEEIAEIQTLPELQVQFNRLATLPHFDGHELGNVEERFKDEFAAIAKREKELIEAMPEAERARILQEQGNLSEKARDRAIEKQKSGKRKTTAIGAAAGAVVGGWATYAQTDGSIMRKAAKAAGRLFGGADPLERASSKVKKAVEIMRNGRPTGASMEVLPSGDSVIHAGKRGVEGAISDLRTTDPEKYKGMMSWIREQYPGTKANDGALIHRIVTRMAEERGFSVDGASNNLSDIDAATVKLASTGDGKFALSLGEVDFDDTPDMYKPSGPGPGDGASAAPDSASLAESSTPDLSNIEQINTRTSDFQPDPSRIETISADAAQNVETAEEVSYVKVLRSVADYDKSSDALKHILHKDYGQFMGEKVGIPAKEINKIQGLKVTDFMKFYSDDTAREVISEGQIKKYRILADSIVSLLEKASPAQREVIKQGSLRNLLIRLATERIRG